MTNIERIPTGIPGLDPLIGGGLIKKSTTLIAGGPGTGKTLLVLQTTNNLLKQGKKVFFLSLESDTDKILQYGESMGFELKKYATERQLIVATPRSEKIIIENIVNDIVAISSTLDVIIIDSITKLLEIALFLTKEKDEEGVEVIKSERELTRQDMWRFILMLQKRLINKNVTLIFVGESEDSGQKITVEGVAEYEVDGIILLKMKPTAMGIERTLNVVKMRDTNIDGRICKLEITDKGLVIGLQKDKTI